MRDIKYRDDGRPEDLLQELGYETQDIAYKKFSIYGAYFFGFFTVCIFLGFVFMYFFSPTKLTGGRMGDSKPKTTMPAGTPLLQTNVSARTDIRSLRQKETAVLDTSGVVDEGKGIYRIPIDKAIDTLASESDTDRAKMGLPASAAPKFDDRSRRLDTTVPPPTTGDWGSIDASPFVTGESTTSQSANGGHGG